MLGQRRGRRGGQRADAREAGQRRRCGGPSDVGMLGAVDELQRLRQELDVDQTAAAELHVPAAGRLLAQLDLHARAHLADLLERASGSGAP